MNTKIIGLGVLVVFCIARAFGGKEKQITAVLPKNTKTVWLVKNGINTSQEREWQ